MHVISSGHDCDLKARSEEDTCKECSDFFLVDDNNVILNLNLLN